LHIASVLPTLCDASIDKLAKCPAGGTVLDLRGSLDFAE
jgi:hypothetical protein